MKIIALMLVSFFVVNPSFSQDDTPDNSTEGKRYVCVSLANQIVRCGFLMSDDGREILLETPNLGKVVINKSDVLSIDDAPENSTSTLGMGGSRLERDIRATDQAPQASRYFFAPSAHPMEVGESYIHLNPLMLNYTTQISKNFMGGLAVSWIGVGATFKSTINISEKSNMSIGGMAMFSWVNSDLFLFPFVNYTQGDENNNFTMSFATLAAPFGSSVTNNHVSPMINFSAAKQINQSAWFITENYYFFNPMFFNENFVLSLGGRWYSRPRMNAFNPYALVSSQQPSLREGGLMMIIEANGDILPIPWFGWTWPF